MCFIAAFLVALLALALAYATGDDRLPTPPPDATFADHYRQLQEEARRAGRGLWAQ